MTEEQWQLMVRQLVAQGVVKDEAEAIARLERGEKLPFKAKVNANEWRGIYGTAE